jgi:hypothetical protein
MGFAEPVLGLAEGKTRGLNPSYTLLFPCFRSGSSLFSLLLFVGSARAPFPSLFQ